MASRLEAQPRELPIYVISCHFPRSGDKTGHKDRWKCIIKLVPEYEILGHTKSNGDKIEDAAGKRMSKITNKLRLTIG